MDRYVAGLKDRQMGRLINTGKVIQWKQIRE